jgi:hypothetical protein
MVTTNALPLKAALGDEASGLANGNVQPPPAQPVGAIIASAVSHPNPPQPPVAFEAASDQLVSEIKLFERDSCARYKFNNRWDVFLSLLGIALSIAVVGAGFVPNKPWVTAILGAVVGAVVTAQKAFPFGQRAAFYRILVGQSRNLITRAEQKITDKAIVVNTLASLRMDFAQQLPRGSSSQSSDNPAPARPAAPAAGLGLQAPGANANIAALP